MEELNKYNKTIIELYKQGLAITYIGEFLYKKINTRLILFNKKSNGELWISIPKISKENCMGHVYNILYKYITNNKNGGN